MASAVVDRAAGPLWDADGVPTRRHPRCPWCGEDELGSHADAVWCHACGWRGSLTALWARADAAGAAGGGTGT